MRIPLIKVRDTDGAPRTHIVGADTHDTLHIDSHGGLQYVNLQCCEGTEKCGGESGYEFVGTEYDFATCPQIEFVSVEVFLKIIAGRAYMKQCPQLQAEYAVHCKEMLRLLNEADRIFRGKMNARLAEMMEELFREDGAHE